jgi:hypothetical protein
MLHPGNTLLGCASVFALASAALKDDAALQEQYAARAVELLCQMGATGYADLKGLETYPEFESLRDRPDFRRLLDELRAKTPKKP